jgi:hypothetical protein
MIIDHQINLFARLKMVSFYTASAESSRSHPPIFGVASVRFTPEAAAELE